MFKKVLAAVIAAAMLLTCAPFAFAQGSSDGYTITNPYADIDWATINQYKAALHTHTNASAVSKATEPAGRSFVLIFSSLKSDFISENNFSI